MLIKLNHVWWVYTSAELQPQVKSLGRAIKCSNYYHLKYASATLMELSLFYLFIF